MVLNVEEGLECEARVDSMRLECRNLNAWAVFWMNQVDESECCRKVMSGRRVADAIRYLVNPKVIQLECA